MIDAVESPSRPRTVLGVHNAYGAPSGEETEFGLILSLLEERGHRVLRFERGSSELGESLRGKAKGFSTGIWNPWSARALEALVRAERPDVCLVQNLFPLISPSVLPVLGRARVPTIMRVANFRLLCPNGLFFSKGEVCERCTGGREYWCVLRNCEGSLPKSVGYALRAIVARQTRAFHDNIAAYLVSSGFLKTKLTNADYREDRIFVVPNLVEGPPTREHTHTGRHVAFAGRLSQEKGLAILLEIARALPQIPFHVAGRLSPGVRPWGSLPVNVKLRGYLVGDELEAFYRDAAFLLSTSECYETFGMVVAEAALRGRTSVVSGHGPLGELVRNGVTGILVRPGDVQGFSEAVRRLWSDKALAARLGEAARQNAELNYGPDTYYARLSGVMDFVEHRAARQSTPE